MDECYRCGAEYPESRTYCSRCGRIRGFFEVPLSMNEETCVYHTGILATSYCVLCARPICGTCLLRKGVSLLSSLPTPQCRECVTASENLEAEYFADLRAQGKCINHPIALASVACSNCDAKYCLDCLFFAGLWYMPWRLHVGPLCLQCLDRQAGYRNNYRTVRASSPRGQRALANIITKSLS